MQNTLLAPIRLSGLGFWRCQDVDVRIVPANVDTGIWFIREDLPGKPAIAALPKNRIPADHRTCLGLQKDGQIIAQVDMVEHIMAALFTMDVANCRIYLNAQELPALDGSGDPYVKAINSVGVLPQSSSLKSWRVTRPIEIVIGDSSLRVEPPEPEVLVANVLYELDYPQCSAIGRQEFATSFYRESLRDEVMPARTFATQQEAFTLQARGLCRRITAKDCLIFSAEGVVDNDLRFKDECARHKIQDLVGDLFIGGIEWIGRFQGKGSGHAHNHQMLDKLLQQRELEQNNSV